MKAEVHKAKLKAFSLLNKPVLRALVSIIGVLGCNAVAHAQTCPLSYGTTDAAKSHWLFLYFPTASDSTFPSYGTKVSPVPAFDVSLLSAGIGTTAQLISEIKSVVADDYCEFNVQVHTTTTNPATMPSPPARRVTVAIGADSNGSTAAGFAWGLAQEVDGGDKFDIDFARVWAGTYVNCEGGNWPAGTGCSTAGSLTGTNATLNHWAQAIGGTAAHEAGHTYGLAHSDDNPPDVISEPGPAPLPGEDPYYQHLMPSGSNLTGPERADYRRHFSDRTFGILATNVGLSIQTMHNWNLTNPNAETASSLSIDFLSSLPSMTLSWTFGGNSSPWVNPTVSGPNGTTMFKGVTYNKYTITWSSPNPAWTDSSPGVVAGGAVFHIGATFTGVDFNAPDPIIIQDVTLLDARSNALVLHPRLAGYDAGTIDASGDFSLHFFQQGPTLLQIKSVRMYQLPRVASLESMLGEGRPLDRDQAPIRPWNVKECVPTDARGTATCKIANLADKPNVQVVYQVGQPGVIDCSRGGNVQVAQSTSVHDRSYPLDYEGPICAGTTLDPFPSTTVYVIAQFVDPAAKHYDRVLKTYVVGPVVSTAYYQFAGTRQRPSPPTVALAPGKLFAGVITGASWPVGAMRKNYNAGFLFGGFLERNVTPSTTPFTGRVGVQLGFHEFAAKNTGVPLRPDLGVTNLSLTGRIMGGGNYRPFLLGGFGLYHGLGVTKAGGQIGVGLDVPISNFVSLTSGATLQTAGKFNPQLGRPIWFDAYLGIVLRVR